MSRVVLLSCLAFALASQLLQSQDSMHEPVRASQIHSTLFAEFLKLDSTLARVELNDVKSAFADPIVSMNRPNRFLVLARGIYFSGSSETEKLGLFVFDDSLATILRTIDIIDYAGDYEFTIAKIWKDTLTLHADSPGKGLGSFDKKYKLYFSSQYR